MGWVERELAHLKDLFLNPVQGGSFATWFTGCISSANSETVAAVIVPVLASDDLFVLIV